MNLTDAEIVTIEVNALLDVLFHRAGYDFRNYSRASLLRRLEFFTEQEGFKKISDLIPMVIHDEPLTRRLIKGLLINVTEMFRDPAFFKTLTEDVFPVLKTYPFFKIWHAGCSTGEEVYSLAILLQEHGLLGRARIYGTDLNAQIIKKAKDGIFKESDIHAYAENYVAAGGQRQLTDYFYSRYGSAKINDELTRNITFASHNLVSDGIFTEVQMIICRNVMIYFDTNLKQKVIGLFYQGLTPGGLLCLGSKESLNYSEDASCFETMSLDSRIYKKQISSAKQVSKANSNIDVSAEIKARPNVGQLHAF
ncbi:protein-glutamate O-methyltransferase CheR [Litoribacillus peritrichatus]|uniref:Protein-glutamate O-methyltransferase CheR n=1 Tax=Litoribacillus peritrichatus TaxID=718191 RepID=A0ABP7MTY8_9GAMM